MKKFMVVIISLIVTVSLGFTVYAFIKNNEQIKVVQSNYYINANDEFDIAYEFVHPKKQTKITYDLVDAPGIERVAGTENKFKGVAGGQFTLRVKTTNKNFAEFTISITVGDGSKKYPFYIKSKDDFLSLGTGIKTMDKNYILTTDIDLAGENFRSLDALSGNFNGNGYAIKNATVSNGENTIALFKQIASTGKVENVTLENFDFAGTFSNAAIVANFNNGIIKNVNIKDCKITNNSTSSDAKTAGVAVYNQSEGDVQARIDRVACKVEINAKSSIGGIAAKNKGAVIINSYSRGALNGTETTKIAGLTIDNENNGDKPAYIKDCYSICVIPQEVITKASLVINNVGEDNIIRGCYYCEELTNCNTGITDFELTAAYQVNQISTSEIGNLNNFISYAVGRESFKWSNVVWYIDAEGYPTIDFSAADVPDDMGIKGGDEIRTLSQLIDLFKTESTATTKYILKEDIYLTEETNFAPLGVTDNGVIPFNGIFEAAYNEEKGRYYTIFDLSIATDRENNGLFAEFGSTAQIINIRIENVKISGGKNVGSLVGTNNGIIDNCEIVHKDNDGIGGSDVDIENLGGIAGVNNGTILNSSCEVTINAKTYSSARNVGGIAGNNANAVYNTVSSCKINVTGLDDIYVGGIVGYNTAIVSYCKFDSEIIADMEGNNTIGGICGYTVSSSRIISCNVSSKATLEGNKVGGFIGYCQKSQVKECFIEAVLHGNQVGGVAFSAPEIVMQDVNVQCYIYGRDGGSVKAGIAVELPDNSNSYCGPIFLSVTFDDTGDNYVTSYYVTTSAWPWEWNPNGIKITSAIFDKTTMKNAKRWILGDIVLFNKLPINQDGGCTIDVCYGYEGNQVFIEKGFSTLTWKFEKDSYPQLNNIKE